MRSCWVGVLSASVVVACSVFGADEDPAKPAAADGTIGGPPDASLNGALNARGTVRVDVPQDFAANQQTPGPIVSDPAAVYWLNLPFGSAKGAIMKKPKGGGEPEVLSRDLPPGPISLVQDATHLFVSTNGSEGGDFQYILRKDKVGTEPVRLVLVDANDEMAEIAVAAGSVFWSLTEEGSVGFVDANTFTSTPKVTVAEKVGPVQTVAADGSHIYAAARGKILKIDVATREVVDFATTSGFAKAMVLDTGTATLFWTEAATVRKLDTKAPGAPPTNLASGQQGATAIALDAKYVYWTNLGDGSIRVVAKTGGAWGAIAAGEKEPHGIAVDESGVYWTNRGDNRVRFTPRAR